MLRVSIKTLMTSAALVLAAGISITASAEEEEEAVATVNGVIVPIVIRPSDLSQLSIQKFQSLPKNGELFNLVRFTNYKKRTNFTFKTPSATYF